MPKGQLLHLTPHSFTDPNTGARVTRLTPPDVTCHRTYFYQRCFTQGGDGLLFGGLFDGDWNLYLLDLATHQARQLTEGSGDNTFGAFLSPDDRAVYYVKAGRELRRVHLDTLHEDVVYTVAEGQRGYGTWVANSECTHMVGIEVADGDLLPLDTWAGFRDTFWRNPRCRLIVIDLRSGEAQVIHQEARWLGHPMYRPDPPASDPHAHRPPTVAYCHEGPHDLVQRRMWLIDGDGGHARPVRPHVPGESCTHEFWVPDGSRLIYVLYRAGQRDRLICAADPDTLTNETLMTMPPCSHLMSNFDGTLLVGDGSGPPEDVADASAHQFEPDPFLHLFDLRARTSRPLAGHHSSWRVHLGSRQVTHPHPSFTPDERAVLFTSDMHGEPALYLADLGHPQA